MRIHISGEITDDVRKDEDGSRYHISADGTEYEVVTRGRQAIKDYLFVRKHQQVEIEGILEAKRIFIEKAKIRLKNEKECASQKNSGREGEKDEDTRGTTNGGKQL